MGCGEPGKVREALMTLGPHPDRPPGAFGRHGEVEPVRHLIGRPWHGAAIRKGRRCISTSRPSTQRRDDGLSADGQGRTGRRLLVDQRLQRRRLFEEHRGVYALNNVTATTDADGAITVQFGGCDGNGRQLPADRRRAGTTWCGSTVPAPRSSTGTWTFPEAVPQP